MKTGDIVIMNGKCEIAKGDEFRIWEVASEPCALQDKVVVNLKGRKGGYPVEGLSVIFGGGNEKG